MRIYVNGEAKRVTPSATVARLLAELGLAERRLAVEVNQEIVPRSRHGEHRLRENDRIEVVVAVGGG